MVAVPDRRCFVTGPKSGALFAQDTNAEVARLYDGIGFKVTIDPVASSANSIVGTVDPSLDAWKPGQLYYIRPTLNNTGPANLDLGRGAKSLVGVTGAALASGALTAGTLYAFVYDGSVLAQLAVPGPAGAAGTSGAANQYATLTALKAATLADGLAVILAGRTVAGDAGGGIFVKTNDDLSSILVPQTLVAAGLSAVADTISLDATEIHTGAVLFPTTTANGLTANTRYWAKYVDEGTIKLAVSWADLKIENYVNITGVFSALTLKVLLDPDQAIYVIHGSDAIDGSAGASVRQGWNKSGVSVGWWGAVPDGVTDCTNAIQAPLYFVGYIGGGDAELLNGTHLTSMPLWFPHKNVDLVGHGGGQEVGPATTTAASWVVGSHLVGPIIRRLRDNCGLREFNIGATTLRNNALRIIGSNYLAEGLTRDEQNYGVWTEAPDYDIALYVTDCHDRAVWVQDQPNDGWVWMAGYYRSGQEGCGARTNKGHGLVEGWGVHTDRDAGAILAGGILETHKTGIIQCTGHSVVTGHPDEPSGSVVRSLHYNLDTYNCGTDDSIMFDPDYIIWRMCDEGQMVDGAFSALANGTPGKSAIFAAGRVNQFHNNRYLHLNAIRSPIKWKHSHTPSGGVARLSGGLVVRHGFISTNAGTGAPGFPYGTGVTPAIVEMTGQDDGSAIVEKNTIDGTFGGDLVIGGMPFRESRGGVGRAYGVEHFHYRLMMDGFFELVPTDIKIIGGVATIPSDLGEGASWIRLESETGAADNLDKIVFDTAGPSTPLIMLTALTGHAITVRRADQDGHVGSNNEYLALTAATKVLDNVVKALFVQRDSNLWVQRTELVAPTVV